MLVSLLCEKKHFTDIFDFTIFFCAIKKSGSDKGTKI